MKNIGMVVFVIASLVLWYFTMSGFYEWWGSGGVIAGFVLAPISAVYPFLFWFKEGVFPVLYFAVWAVGIVGYVVSSSDE